jgi:hypothetical protein
MNPIVVTLTISNLSYDPVSGNVTMIGNATGTPADVQNTLFKGATPSGGLHILMPADATVQLPGPGTQVYATLTLTPASVPVNATA